MLSFLAAHCVVVLLCRQFVISPDSSRGSVFVILDFSPHRDAASIFPADFCIAGAAGSLPVRESRVDKARKTRETLRQLRTPKVCLPRHMSRQACCKTRIEERVLLRTAVWQVTWWRPSQTRRMMRQMHATENLQQSIQQ